MSTQLPQAGDQASVIPAEPPISGSAHVLPGQPPGADDEPTYLLVDDERDGSLFDTQSVAPFQLSNALPPLHDTVKSDLSGQLPPLPPQPQPQRRKRRKLPLLLFVGLSTVVLVLIITVVMTAFAVQATSRRPQAATVPRQSTASVKPLPPQKRGTTQTPKTTPQTRATQRGPTDQATTWTGGPLPADWMNAGLIKADAVQAQYTGMTFTDREMALDFRNAGTRAAHAGTFTAATFLLTPAARVRFANNDVRVINNALFDRVAQEKLVQVAVDATPRLVKFQAQGNRQLAWIDVAFHLWQSRLDPRSGQRSEGLEMDTVMHQPRIHHMSVLLVRVAPETQGANAPMGGTGWLVSNYGLDQPGPVDIVQPV
jgi:hypothetical protein